MDDSVRDRLETIDQLARTVLTDIQNDDAADLEDVDDKRSREARRRLREIRSETRCVGLVLFGPDAALPEGDEKHGFDIPMISHHGPAGTTHLGPEPAAFEREYETHDPQDAESEGETTDSETHDPETDHESLNPDHNTGDHDGE